MKTIRQEDIISVIVPIYNIEKNLPRCLDCISCQSYQNLDIILVDDASTDDSGKICDLFVSADSRARVIHHSRRMGIGNARNSGQSIARGIYFWFPDGDDYFHKDILRILYEAIIQKPEFGIAMVEGKKTLRLDEDTTRPISQVAKEELSQTAFFELVAKGPEGVVWNKLYKRDILTNTWSKPYSLSQDLDFNLRVSFLVNRIVSVKKSLYYWVQRPDSVRRAPNASTVYLSCHAAIYFSNYQSLPDTLKAEGYLLLQQLYYRLIQWKEHVRGSVGKKEAFKECRTYVRKTWASYLLSRRINLVERFVCFLLVLHPRLVHLCILIKQKGPAKGMIGNLSYTLSVFLLSFAYL